MTEEHKRLLNSIGFVLEVSTKTKNKAPWEEMYQRLVAYKKEHMHTRVPKKYKEDLNLGGWVHNQHKAYKKKILKEEWKHLLNSIGFAWQISLS